MSEQFRLTDKGRQMVEEMNYGHNPLAYLCSERPDGQKPLSSEELCVICADGFEALNWKRKALEARAARVAQLRVLGAELQELCVEAIGRANTAQVVENIVKYRAMADAYGNAAELAWLRADELAGKS